MAGCAGIALVCACALPAAASGASPRGDFDGNGRDDLAVGVPFEDLASGANNSDGAVNVLYGARRGLRARGSQFFHQDRPGMAGDGAEQFDFFGSSLATGDFDGDGRDDLAVGVPGEDVASGANNGDGAVNVLYGARRGLRARGSQFFHQDSAGMAGDGAEQFDSFGFSLAAGDFDGDGRDDLAVGVENEGVASGANNGDGAVNVLYGTRRGLRTRGSQFFHQDKPGVAGDGAELNDIFGWSLAAGHFDRGDRADLAIGVLAEDVASGANNNDGAVNVLYGTRRGLRTRGSQFFHQDKPGMAGDGAEMGDLFGDSLAAGDFDAGRRDDLAVGLPHEDVASGANNDDGAVNVLLGTRRGLRTTGSQFLHQDKPGMAGDGAELDDNFGRSVAAGDFGSGGRADLAVGVAHEGVASGANDGDGAVNVLYGGRRGLRTRGSEFLHQDKPGMAGDGAELDDEFGFSLAAGDFGSGGRADLAVGVRSEGVASGANDEDGALNVLYGGRGGLRTRGSQFFHQNKPRMAGDGAEQDDSFGCALPRSGGVCAD